jgi:hypothetical protein
VGLKFCGCEDGVIFIQYDVEKELFLLQLTSLKEELFCRNILRETEISHFTSRANFSVMAQ